MVSNCKQWLLVILECVDYTEGNCKLNEMIGDILPREVIEQARKACSEEVDGILKPYKKVADAAFALVDINVRNVMQTAEYMEKLNEALTELANTEIKLGNGI